MYHNRSVGIVMQRAADDCPLRSQLLNGYLTSSSHLEPCVGLEFGPHRTPNTKDKCPAPVVR
jgi:hypothetical protein